MGDKLVAYSLIDYSFSHVAILDFSLLERLVLRFGFLKRLFRYIPRAMKVISENEFCFVLKKKLYRVRISDKEMVCLHSNIGSNALSLTRSHCKKYILFGDYNANENLDPVFVNFIDIETGELHKKTIFDSGDVNHVHNIISFKDGYIVLTGDTGSKTGFYFFDNDFVSFRCLFSKGQLSRACWLHEAGGNFYFATDSQYDPNFLLSVNLDDGSYSKIASIENSSIYSCVKGKNIYFSTTVEPGYYNHNFFLDLLDDRIGNGITSRSSRLYCFDGKYLKLLDKQKKDFLPMRLFQFGVFSFPDFMYRESDFMVYNCIALKGLSCATVVLIEQ
jgi:hypothetical protein